MMLQWGDGKSEAEKEKVVAEKSLMMSQLKLKEAWAARAVVVADLTTGGNHSIRGTETGSRVEVWVRVKRGGCPSLAWWRCEEAGAEEEAQENQQNREIDSRPQMKRAGKAKPGSVDPGAACGCSQPPSASASGELVWMLGGVRLGE